MGRDGCEEQIICALVPCLYISTPGPIFLIWKSPKCLLSKQEKKKSFSPAGSKWGSSFSFCCHISLVSFNMGPPLCCSLYFFFSSHGCCFNSHLYFTGTGPFYCFQNDHPPFCLSWPSCIMLQASSWICHSWAYNSSVLPFSKKKFYPLQHRLEVPQYLATPNLPTAPWKSSQFITRRLNIVQISHLPNLTYRFNVIPIKTPESCLMAINKLILMFNMEGKRHQQPTPCWRRGTKLEDWHYLTLRHTRNPTR